MTQKIRKAAVLGSGVMGGAIAALLASAGVKTTLLDIIPFDLKGDEKKDPKARNKIVEQGFNNLLTARPAALMTPGDAKFISIGNLEDDFDRLADCDWIIEVVLENLEVKQKLFKRIQAVRKKDAIVSSNTSGIPLEKITQGLSPEFKSHFLGTHFFNPVRYMHLLELIPGQETKQEVLDFIADFGSKRLGKGIVWAKDTPNFIGNRIGIFNSLNNIHTMMEQGLSIPEVDALMGPALGRAKTAQFRTGDLVGLDILYQVAENTHALLPDDSEKARFKAPDFLGAMVEKKYLGNKTRGGFYKKVTDKNGQRTILVINPDTLEYEPFEKPDFPCLDQAAKAGTLTEKIQAMVFGKDRGSAYVWKCLSRTWIYAANRIPEISDTILEIDKAVRWGFNAAMGPFEMWDAAGVETAVERMISDKLEVPDAVMKMLNNGCKTFYKTENSIQYYYDFSSQKYLAKLVQEEELDLKVLKSGTGLVKSCASASLIDLGDGVFCCEFHTKMNALSPEIKVFIDECLDYVNENGQGLIYGNQAAKAFSAGADLKAMAKRAKAGNFDEISRGVASFQAVIQKAKYAPFPVVAAPFGMTLGGGCEICLGADRIVAHTELYMGLVEVGVGLLPAGAGCLNLWKKVSKRLGPPINGADLMAAFMPVFSAIAMAKVSTSAAEARINGFLGETDRIVFNRDCLIAEAKKEVLRMVEDGYSPPLKTDITVLGDAAQGPVAAYLMNMTKGGFISDYDAFLANRIARVISGGEVGNATPVDEEVILTLERKTFIENLTQEKTMERITHLLATGKPLRN
ncbi:MAG: 3-hydroxyacyl-CoA dehydrogenase/enoyl-CoA hydratase family protein [Desulfobacteraceae bacterium]|nr:3-hydroxyacyl-CoA dehydrogenase/enoyl-CoA hydratase family protein [Desulfobacteraceae bacterium]